MTLETLLSRLQQMAPDLQSRGIEAVYIFGSFARDQARESSDIDLIVRLVSDCISLCGLAELCHELEQRFERSVDITTFPLSNPHLRAEIERDMVQVF